MKTHILFILTCMILASTLALAAEPGNKAIKSLIEQHSKDHPNPHKQLPCSVCHGTDDVRKTASGEVPFANPDITTLCYNCHTTYRNIHPVDQKPSMKVPANLPLRDGKITCLTCHNMHMSETREHLLRGYDNGTYKNRQDLCIDCHGERFVKKNPHVNQKERGLCVFCHQTEPSTMDKASTVKFRFGILRTCNFCHNVVEKNHPVNVDKDVAPPSSLPRDIDGSVTCATCHDPHGTTDTLHFLRREYIVTLESVRNFSPHKGDCEACHKKAPTKGQSLDVVYKGLKFNGEVGLLCNSCHGTHSVHPVDIQPPKEMTVSKTLPLDANGKINCITCHDMNCGGDKVKLRHYNEKDGSMKGLCYSCHDEKIFSKTNPHRDMDSGEGCLFCHERQPDKRVDKRGTVSFITSMRMICLRCHERFPHPAGVEHLVEPKMTVPPDMPLDDAGQITCITCHNPHIGGEKGGADSRHRRLGDELCNACHTRK